MVNVQELTNVKSETYYKWTYSINSIITILPNHSDTINAHEISVDGNYNLLV